MLSMPHAQPTVPDPRQADAWRAAEVWEAAASEGSRGSRGCCRVARWLDECLEPRRRVLFLDTDTMGGQATGGQATGGAAATASGWIGAPEERTDGAHGHVLNRYEAALSVQLLLALVACGVPHEQVALIAPYRAQLRAVGAALAAAAPELERSGVELLTVDKCQGRDYECVVLSMVRSNPDGDTGGLLADARRLNVAFSRAKHKMVLIGSLSTLRHSVALGGVLRLAREAGWVVELPPKAHVLYQTPHAHARPHAESSSRAVPTPAPMPAHSSAGVRRAGAPASRVAVAADRPITAAILGELCEQPPIVVPSAAPHGMDELENRSWQRDGVREGLRGSAACAHPPKGTARQGANEPSEMSW